MNTSSSKEARKRENEQSPMKKKFKDSAISKEELNAAIANGIKLALQEQQRGLDVAVASAVRAAVDSILVPALRDLRIEIQKTNETVKEFGSELEKVAKSTKRVQDRVEAVQTAAREDRRSVIELKTQLDQLTTKLTDLEDRGRRNNVRLVGLPETVEGSDAVGYLKVNLPKWIPSLVGRDIDIERAHRVYDGGEAKSNKPRTLIFRLLTPHAHAAAPTAGTILFFPDYSPATTAKRKSFSSTMKKARDMGLEPFLIYPARLKLQYYGEKKMFDSPQAAEDFLNSLPRRSTLTPVRREGDVTDLASNPIKENNHGDPPHAREGNLVDMGE
uniref:L1 transposable element RRM domain-containing protein n=1 Tax=Esox lucius TaxID=8010 RepID=A0AAY5JXT6_ESOLU